MTTGDGFCYSIGRVASASGTAVFIVATTVLDDRTARIALGRLFVPAGLLALAPPDLDDPENPIQTDSIP